MKDLGELAAETVERLIHRLGIDMTTKQQELARSLLWSEFDEVRTEVIDEYAAQVLNG